MNVYVVAIVSCGQCMRSALKFLRTFTNSAPYLMTNRPKSVQYQTECTECSIFLLSGSDMNSNHKNYGQN